MTLKEQIYADKRQEVEKEYLHAELTEKIIKAFYAVYNSLGYGFLEKVYENALYLELLNLGLPVVRQHPITVFYQEKEVGQYYADLLVDDLVILELKAAEAICKEHEFQLINYLKATKMEVGLLLNFGTKPQVKRKIFTNRPIVDPPLHIHQHAAPTT